MTIGPNWRHGLAACSLAPLTWHAAMAAPPVEALPQRNLLVAWRMSSQEPSRQHQQGVRTGQVILDSRGGVIGQSSMGLSTVQTDTQADTVQQVQVLNGGRARLYVGRSQPYTVWQWAWTGGAGSSGNQGSSGGASTANEANMPIGAQAGAAVPTGQGASAAQQPAYGGGPQVWAQTVWIDIGQGLNVRPRWRGGHAPVIVELEARVRQPLKAGSAAGGTMNGAYEPDGQTRRVEVGSTLSVPLGQWVVVARSGSQGQSEQAGTLSTRTLDETESQQLEIRITAP